MSSAAERVVWIVRTIMYVAATVLAATGAAQASAAASPAAARADFSRCAYSVTTDGAQLRSGPGSTSTVLGLLREICRRLETEQFPPRRSDRWHSARGAVYAPTRTT